MPKYFISYTFSNNNYSHGFGNIETTYGKEIKSMEDIKVISRNIERDLKFDENSLVLLNYIRMD